MSEKQFDLLIFIGRFRPFHLGHKHVIDEALVQSHNVLVLVGSANRPRTAKNPWTYEEVRHMIQTTYGLEGTAPREVPLNVAPLDDWMHDNDFRWMMHVQRAVQNEVERIQQWAGRETPLRVGLVGFAKDHSSYYLKKFPQWGSVAVPGVRVEGKLLDATTIRERLLESTTLTWNTVALHHMLPLEVAQYLSRWLSFSHNVTLMRNLKQAVDFAKDYKEKHRYIGGQSYEAIHTTSDAVVIQSGHVLLIRRKVNPGAGLWALPGGFAHARETLANSSSRELKEETKIALSRGVLDLAFRFKHVFSDPNRSDDRGRIITHAYLYLLNDRTELPEVEADDDAAEVRWVPLGLLNAREMYSDHFYIIHKMIDMIPVD